MRVIRITVLNVASFLHNLQFNFYYSDYKLTGLSNLFIVLFHFCGELQISEYMIYFFALSFHK